MESDYCDDFEALSEESYATWPNQGSGVDGVELSVLV